MLRKTQEFRFKAWTFNKVNMVHFVKNLHWLILEYKKDKIMKSKHLTKFVISIS
jgi:hypothetical protein